MLAIRKAGRGKVLLEFVTEEKRSRNISKRSCVWHLKGEKGAAV